MSSPPPNTWQDRRGMFQAGKAVHEPGKITGGSSVVDAIRRASVSSTSGEAMKPPAEPETTTTGRRRSSGVPFENLATLKRGSQDYGDRRTSHSEMQGSSGLVSGWFNRTFRGMTGPASAAGAPTEQQPKQESRRGVMEWLEARTDSV